MIVKLAFKNIFKSGFRTWLNIFILSVAYFAIIALQGFFVGWSEDASREIKDWHIANGQFWQKNYDPYDPFTLDDSHAPIPAKLENLIKQGDAVPILIASASVYPQGRMKNIVLKGIDPKQKLLKIPTDYLKEDSEEPLAIIGSRTAKSCELQVGDYVTLRWRDLNGVWDATDLKIAHIFETTVLAVDTNTFWLPIAKMQQMFGMENEATKIVVKNVPTNVDYPDWTFKDEAFLLQDLKNMIQAKTVGSSIMYLLLLFMASIAIFDTQILSIFRRRKEMGTLMALGMTRSRIIALFTMEGSLHAVLAIFLGAIYGVPLLQYFEKVGMNFGASGDDYGISGLTDTLYPQYSWKLVLGTIILVLIVVTFVSFFPTRRIAKLKPTDALRGKMTN